MPEKRVIYDVNEADIIDEFQDGVFQELDSTNTADPQIFDNELVTDALKNAVSDLLHFSRFLEPTKELLVNLQPLLSDGKGLEALSKLKEHEVLANYVKERLMPSDGYMNAVYELAEGELQSELNRFFAKEENNKICLISGKHNDECIYDIQKAEDLLNIIRADSESGLTGIKIEITSDNVFDITVYDHTAVLGRPVMAIPLNRVIDVLSKPENKYMAQTADEQGIWEKLSAYKKETKNNKKKKKKQFSR